MFIVSFLGGKPDDVTVLLALVASKWRSFIRIIKEC